MARTKSLPWLSRQLLAAQSLPLPWFANPASHKPDQWLAVWLSVVSGLILWAAVVIAHEISTTNRLEQQLIAVNQSLQLRQSALNSVSQVLAADSALLAAPGDPARQNLVDLAATLGDHLLIDTIYMMNPGEDLVLLYSYSSTPPALDLPTLVRTDELLKDDSGAIWLFAASAEPTGMPQVFAGINLNHEIARMRHANPGIAAIALCSQDWQASSGGYLPTGLLENPGLDLIVRRAVLMLGANRLTLALASSRLDYLPISLAGLILYILAAYSLLAYWITRQNLSMTQVSIALSRISTRIGSLATTSNHHETPASSSDQNAMTTSSTALQLVQMSTYPAKNRQPLEAQLGMLHVQVDHLVENLAASQHQQSAALEMLRIYQVKLQTYLHTTTLLAQVLTETLHNYLPLSAAVSTIGGNLGYAYVGLSLFDRGEIVLKARYLQDPALAAQEIDGYQVVLPRYGVVGWVAKNGRPMRVDDLLTLRQPALHLDALPHSRSQLALPIQVGDKLFGVLDLQSSESGAFGEEDVPVLQSLADQIALAVYQHTKKNRV